MPNEVGSPVQNCGPVTPTEEPKKDPHWIKFKLQDDKGKPVANTTIKITLPDGSIEEKTSDDTGLIEISDVKPGDCKIVSDWDDSTVHETLFIQ